MTRPDWIGLLSRSAPDALTALWPAVGDLPAPDWLRRPETGSVMVRGRTGGTGAAFNLGEVTVTRCALRHEGVEGHAFVQGRDAAHATRAAWIDALMQTDRAEALARDVLAPLAEAERARRETRARKAEATRVDFETMVRGED
ncbi:phosphonate C-P lyase system protein PhnG [Jannaschia seohaensis]|uniref:Alpha-D-ribose 1-methylphosphonate 5-triphosphate synthase subunit PhnG n=1 Tax=Jannaschia seohaensis TaxID=475081 RepID=A0A2Y9A0V0_9RHOB|nr:phosphonate C-P lyase system protein PhnG [Jannaschia seohaensis]PWJ21883.1 alpha-D-ribose 1-methylphosphonate 5-triphosphate synthase subunit PhnG [Jannaschia seohaensis]SSA38161.1 alpha-D-ribose 1-methylphosphonate 5-triphosphate synthase subunit PhnG [Jannaschia seohaensis]